jgi:catechol 2,3-dioxygenase-like lactoylglutathione lyase family enzyme
MNLNHVTVSVSDIEKATEFYQKLGLEIIFKADHYCRFVVPGNEATFSIHRSGIFIPGETVVYFETADVDATIEMLKESGITISVEPIMQSWLWYEAYVKDPDGNNICIYHAGENRLNPPWRTKK